MSMYAPIHQAIRALAGMDPDFAQQQNGVGFNKPDTTMGHTLAALPELCDRDAYIAYHLLRKYARQLSNYGISFDQLPVPLEPPNDFFMTIAYHEPGVNFKKAFIVAFEYDQEKITALKSSVNGNSQFASKGAAKFWEVKAHKGVIAALKEFAIEYEFEITKGAHDAMTAIESAPDTTDDTVPTEENYRTISEGRDRYNRECFYVRFPYNPALSEELKIVCRGTGWSGAPLKVWMVPTIREEQLMEWGKRHNFRIDIEGYTPRAELEARRIAEWVELSESALEILGPLEEFRFNDHALYKHQREGIELMIKRGRMILADDMGLGKTLQTLAAAKAFQIAHGYAVFVLAPVSLHRNWVREAQAVEVSIEVYSWAKVPEPPAQTPFILICDEAHYAQNLLSKRTEGFLKLAENAKAVYLATGTPMKNGRPSRS